jgi:hypothetical protein
MYHTGHGGYQYTWLSSEGVNKKNEYEYEPHEVWSKENDKDQVIQPTNRWLYLAAMGRKDRVLCYAE